MDYPWHYHPEFEINFVEKSYGLRFMGNHVGHFGDGDLIFISPNLPHVWRNDEVFYKGDKDHIVDVYGIQFRENALREGVLICLSLPILKSFFPWHNNVY